MVTILAIGGLTMVTVLLACYVCIFRDLCCRYKRRQRSPRQEFDPKLESIPMNNITQEESMPTESEKI